MDTTALAELMKNASLMLQSAISGVAGILLTTLFLRSNTRGSEFEKIKAGKFEEAINELLESGKMTYYEYYKCQNFLKIARIADKEILKSKIEENDFTQFQRTFDFDWYMRFFDGVGNISNESMQSLWARILSGEVSQPGSFSLRALETLRNMTQREAEVFRDSTKFALKETSGSIFLFCSSDGEYEDINERYEFDDPKMLILEECGLLNGMRLENRVDSLNNPYGIFNKNILLHIKLNRKKNFIFKSYAYTQTAMELFPIISEASNDDYLLDLGKAFLKVRGKDLTINAYKIRQISDNDVDCDTSFDLLN